MAAMFVFTNMISELLPGALGIVTWEMSHCLQNFFSSICVYILETIFISLYFFKVERKIAFTYN